MALGLVEFQFFRLQGLHAPSKMSFLWSRFNFFWNSCFTSYKVVGFTIQFAYAISQFAYDLHVTTESALRKLESSGVILSTNWTES